jgi:hypothetical protein
MKQLIYGIKISLTRRIFHYIIILSPPNGYCKKIGDTFMAKTKSKILHCCEKCQNYWTCETKWYRGERGEESICCPLCVFHHICWGERSEPKPRKKKA